LLTTGDLPIPQVARLCGFAGRERFWSAFKKQMKVSPLDYRLERCRLGGALSKKRRGREA